MLSVDPLMAKNILDEEGDKKDEERMWNDDGEMLRFVVRLCNEAIFFCVSLELPDDLMRLWRWRW